MRLAADRSADADETEAEISRKKLLSAQETLRVRCIIRFFVSSHF